ncbi:MAG TPA: CPBP family intramembrane glutamic endopeptidase [Herpetosiphonaceae bacterium]
MKTSKTFITQHPLLSYYFLTFVISWGGLLVIGGPGETDSGTVWQSDPRLPLMILAMLGGPSVAGLLLTSLVSGKTGVRDLGSRLLRWHVDGRWYAIAFLTAPLVYTAVHATLALTDPVYLPTILVTSDKTAMLLSSIAAGLGVGLFEEIGWTGFAIPQLRRRYGVFTTGLIAGVVWGAWHLLTNDLWIGDSYAGGLSLALFWTATGVSLLVGQLLAYRVLMVWVYDRTGSLLVALLMHASLVVCTFIFGARATGAAYLTYVFVLAASWWIVVGVVAMVNHGQFSRQPLPRGAV